MAIATGFEQFNYKNSFIIYLQVIMTCAVLNHRNNLTVITLSENEKFVSYDDNNTMI